MEIRTRLCGDDHPETAADAAALGAILDGMARHHEAERLHRRALAVFEAALGPGYEEVGFALHNLGASLALTGRHSEAEPLHRRALDIKQRTMGRRHPSVAITLREHRLIV